MFFAEGYRGISIYDVHDMYKPTKLAALQIDGWAQALTLTKNEKYLFLV